MKIILKPIKSKNYICTILIGGNYEKEWKKFAKRTWFKYCKKNGLGLIIFRDHLISKNNPNWKTPHWQKLLIGIKLIKNKVKVDNVCFLDSDILINHDMSPNIFKFYNSKKIGLISKYKNLPFDLYECKKKIAFYRNKYISKRYPLDSSLFMSVKNIYKHVGLAPQKNYASTGVIVFNVKKHSKLMQNWFFKYKSKKLSKKLSFEEIFLNYEIQINKLDQWLDYKFQAIWTYEMAYYYTFLYKIRNMSFIAECINQALSRNYFMHFPGKWNESYMWKNNNLFNSRYASEIKKFTKYFKIKATGKPKGFIPLKK